MSFFKDSWNQLFIMTLGTSAAFMISQIDVSSSSQAPRQPQSLPAKKPIDSQSAQAAIAAMTPTPPVAGHKNGNLSGVSVSGDGFVRALTPHTEGQWIVDRNKTNDSDSDNIDEVLLNAKEGDAILIRPGIYKGNFSISKDIKLIGLDRDSVIIESVPQAKNVLEIVSRRVTLKNLTLRYTGDNGRFCALCVERSHLIMDNVTVTADRFSGIRNLVNLVQMRSALISHFEATNFEQAIRIEDSLESEIKITDSTFTKLKNGISLDTASVEFKGLKFDHISQTALIAHDSQIKVDDFKVTDAKMGIYINNSESSLANIEMDNISANGIFLGSPGFGDRKIDMKNITIRHAYKPWAIIDRSRYVFSTSNVMPHPAAEGK